mgnify:CR=1 FL=1
MTNAVLDKETFCRLVEEHQSALYRTARSILSNQQDAEDAVQTVFAKLLCKPRRFNDAEHEKAWLIVCAQNHCRDMLRSAARRCAAELPDDVPDDRTAADGDETLEAVLALPRSTRRACTCTTTKDTAPPTSRSSPARPPRRCAAT